MRLGVLNLFWYGLDPNQHDDVGFYHDDDSDERIANLLSAGNVDLLALIEIVDVKRLETLLSKLQGTWRIRDANGDVVCSRPEPPHSDGVQRVVVAWNDDVIELVRWDKPIATGPRAPVVARLRNRTTDGELTVVAIHPKSGLPRGWWNMPPTQPDHIAGTSRVSHFKAIAEWLDSPREGFSGPTAVLGDFNSIKDSPEAQPLLALADWTWPDPVFHPMTAERRTTRTDPEIIDHIVLSAGIQAAEHQVIAFDELPEFDDAPPPSTVVWKRTTDHRLVRVQINI